MTLSIILGFMFLCTFFLSAQIYRSVVILYKRIERLEEKVDNPVHIVDNPKEWNTLPWDQGGW